MNFVAQEHEICLTSSLDTFNSDNEVYLRIINASRNLVLLPKDPEIAKFSIPSPEQTNYLLPVEPAILAQQKFHKHTSQLLKDNNYNRQHRVKAQQSETFWLPTTETRERPDKLNGIEKTTFLQLQENREKEKLKHFSSNEDRVKFLKQILWESTLLTIEEKTQVEEFLVEYHDIFARHRLDVGRNDVFKVKFTPEYERPVYTQSPPTPIHIRDELQIELALLQHFGIIKTLPFSQFLSPIFAHMKASGKLRPLIDLRNINHLIRHDYDANNFPSFRRWCPPSRKRIFLQIGLLASPLYSADGRSTVHSNAGI